ncbi:hypothetical protein LEP1GSC188_2487 [Leptospira weilii serovar Topaz str. LT2116]|uniref:Uncharacterized protein n=1 Tax=Leptospira weilii serovar Topaz str. LT2116 TaxID=1088540 RepID=M3GUB5_9LEPT|nr:hypothetical protein LEP1GSC188_2487 [Leptospira weilii serovar Topaz str. LT2116]
MIPTGILKSNSQNALDLDWGYIDQVGEWKTNHNSMDL